MLLRFTKMHGLGNDFMMVDLISQPIALNPELIKELSDRRFGIGFDQLLTVRPPARPDSDFRYTIYNADGSEAEQCGNGARCFLRFVRDEGLTTKSTIRLETSNGNITCKLEKDGNVTVDMGKPTLQPGKIPFVAESPQINYQLSLGPEYADNFSISALNVGNPHAVITVPAVDSAPVLEVGPLVERHPRFPEGVNVGFMEVVSRKKIMLRVFERGVGETKACGSGACAAVVAGRLQGALDDTVDVELTGGHLSISWGGDNGTIKMTGPTCKVYEGRLQI
ncbi:MAG: diaminopimelate epimerase [Gammaproteobacteria bacterium]|jgi:diaminopimelate epimerase|nr:diaminopimelate epimerase [Gammaproteobacteria bacterium]MBT5154112.1 diaminopimelate epimerase [Gammaproteobacteria bacterium]MBT5686771.1 diaminopimelate epimerase [Gammaproteobacteria bacterium]MBT5725410.1 diaminopimelate epimerase [Gammaproteobacteria bacterium]MBT6891494.1 diaminopimelate epimerase [Gammaproteobacteria bacterium]